MNSSHESPGGHDPYSTPQSNLGRPLEDAPLASLYQRLGGALVDGGLSSTCLLAPLFMAGDSHLLWESVRTEDKETMMRLLSGGEYPLTAALLSILVVFDLWLLFKDGQTIGKRMVGSRIVRTSGVRAGFIRIVGLREFLSRLLYAVPFVGSAFMIVGHSMILLPQRRCLHDYIADTKVVRI
ncbi:MAG: RDD family protein [bacterium]|nr:RDD family protein [bacterium]